MKGFWCDRAFTQFALIACRISFVILALFVYIVMQGVKAGSLDNEIQ